MGFIEKPAAAQHLRDARILPIYEGTMYPGSRLVAARSAKDGGETC